MSDWKDLDPDNIPGYLMDYVSGWLKGQEIDSINDFNESFQSDSFQEHLNELAETVVEAALAWRER